MSRNHKGQFVSEIVKPLKQRFEEKIMIEDDCWIWTGCKNKGYGYIAINKKPKAAYRVAYELFKGAIPAGEVVRHRCPNKRKDCCNPAHLKLGSQKDNMADAIEDGTISRGEDRHTAKLTDEQVLQFLSEYPNIDGFNWPYCQQVANQYGVKPSTLYEIAKGITWKHLTGL